MVNPFEITNYHRTKEELEEFLLFCIVVAGKTAYIQANKLEQFLVSNQNKLNFKQKEPFNMLKVLYLNDQLLHEIKEAKLGQYTKIFNAFCYICNSNLDLAKCSIEELENIPGVGPKTSRFFMLHSRNCQHAILDTHILKFLKKYDENVPKSTPSNKKIYKKYESLFLDICRSVNKEPAEYDLELWKLYAKRNKNEIYE